MTLQRVCEKLLYKEQRLPHQDHPFLLLTLKKVSEELLDKEHAASPA